MDNFPLNLPTILQPNSLIRQPQTDVSWKKFWKLKVPERIKRITSSVASLIPKSNQSLEDGTSIARNWWTKIRIWHFVI
ncbi:hypothetical protein CMV_024622 [Castanea mollissima]|uniref:Uncharacterized protein n=1 Tax=Castanea mollissima TaxID=60419 RepID=A0A8J4QAD7_9ROSI|nr:hypothetical protein CMV_024622 [Castanea mollissima]